MQISDQEINNQLELILNSPNFTASARLKEFFRFIVEQTLAGNAGQLKAYTIATTVFGRNRDFDPLHDPVVRVETAKLRNRLMEYYFSASEPGNIRIEVPKGGYIPIFSRIGDELAHESPPPIAEHSVQAHPKSKNTAQITVAILPFINLSGNPGQTMFIEGLADEVILGLTRFEDLSVVNSYTTRRLDPNEESLYSIAQRLTVRFMLHGSVQFHDDVICLRAELADAATGTNIWAERFDAKIDDRSFFAIQEAIAQRLVSRIGDSFGSIRRRLAQELASRPDKDLEFYTTMLSYHHWLATFDLNLFLHAKADLEQLVLTDTHNPVMVVASLADLYASDYQLGYNTVPDALDKAQEFALKAIAMDGSSQTAYWALALNFFLRRNWVQFEKIIARVIPLNPANSYMALAAGLVMGLAGHYDKGIELLERGRELNPRAPGWGRIVPYLKHYMTGNFELALNEALMINTPGCFWDPMLRAAAFGQLEKSEEARQAVAELLKIQPDFIEIPLRYIYSLSYNDESVQAFIEGLSKAGLPVK